MQSRIRERTLNSANLISNQISYSDTKIHLLRHVTILAYLILILTVFTIPWDNWAWASPNSVMDGGSGQDAGDTFATALSISTGTFSGDLTDGSDESDYYRIYGSVDQILTIQLEPSTADFDLRLYNPNAVSAAQSTQSAGVPESISYALDQTGDWRIRIYVPSFQAETGTYTFTVTSTTQSDAGSSADAGDSFATALSLTPGSYSGQLVIGSDVNDFYYISGSQGQVLTVTMTPDPQANFDLSLRDPYDSLVIRSDSATDGLTETIEVSFDMGGGWRICVYVPMFFSSNSGGYTFSVSLVGQTDGGTFTDAGDTFSTALPLTTISQSTMTYSGTLIEGSDTVDYYQIGVTSGDQLRVVMIPDTTANFDIEILDPSNTFIAESTSSTSGLEESIEVEVGQSGEWRICVYIPYYQSSGSGGYSLSVGLNDPLPTSHTTTTPVPGNQGPSRNNNSVSSLIIAAIMPFGLIGLILGIAFISTRREQIRERILQGSRRLAVATSGISTRLLTPSASGQGSNRTATDSSLLRPAGVAFFCQVGDRTRPATEAAYQCEACQRFVCTACFEEARLAGIIACPFCKGALQPFNQDP